MSDNLDKIIEALTPDEQRRLRERLDERFAQQAEAAKMEAFHQALLASGLVKTIKTPRASAAGPRRLIEVKGKPLSETIIEERR
jgi:hypothetical protein